MKYYLVAVLSKEDNRELEQLQRPLIKKAKNKKARKFDTLSFKKSK